MWRYRAFYPFLLASSPKPHTPFWRLCVCSYEIRNRLNCPLGMLSLNIWRWPIHPNPACLMSDIFLDWRSWESLPWLQGMDSSHWQIVTIVAVFQYSVTNICWLAWWCAASVLWCWHSGGGARKSALSSRPAWADGREGSVVQSTSCSSMEPRFESEHLRGGSQLSVAPSPWGSTTAFWLLRTLNTHSAQTYVQAKYTYT